METLFYISAAVAVLSTAMVITRRHPVHALLYMIVSLLGVALIFFILGAPYVAALEIIIYAGAIMVLFLFVVMMLNLGLEAKQKEREWFKPRMMLLPSLLSLILLAELLYLITGSPSRSMGEAVVVSKRVGVALFGPYLLGVELASVLLMAAIIGAYHLGRTNKDIDNEDKE
jgi:NADH-quinone oxidoreductase subunit J